MGSRTELSGLPKDRWVVTRKGDKVTVRRNPKYDENPLQTQLPDSLYQTEDIPPEHREDLPSEIKSVIKDWVKDSTPINTVLRYGKSHNYFRNKPELYEKAITGASILSEVINNSQLNQEYVVTRGLGPYDVQRVKKALEDKSSSGVSMIIQDEGFTAVSYQNNTALEYTQPDDQGERYLLISTLHKGDNALFIGNENPSFKRKEGEILLQRKTGYYITGKRTIITDTNEIVHLIDVVYVKSDVK